MGSSAREMMGLSVLILALLASVSVSQPFYTGAYVTTASVAVAQGSATKTLAVAYYNLEQGFLTYVHSSSAGNLSTIFPSRATGVPGTSPIFTGEYCSIADDVAGNVAVSFYDSLNGRLGYVRSRWVGASPTDTVAWNTAIVYPDESGNVGMWTSMVKLPSGQPAIAYQDNSNQAGGVKFVRAADSEGVAWTSPSIVLLRSGAGQFVTLRVVGGRPAVAYYDA